MQQELPQRGPVRPPGIPAAAWQREIGEPLRGGGRPIPGSRATDEGSWQGLPLGGLGSGSIGRTYKGNFARWHLDPSRPIYQTAPANQFLLFVSRGKATRARILYPGKPKGAPYDWNWDFPDTGGAYYALFPKSWYVYEPWATGLLLRCKQFSPVIPHNYKESSYPVAIFEWTVENPTEQIMTIGLAFTWENSAGYDGDWQPVGGAQNAAWDYRDPNQNVRYKGVTLSNNWPGPDGRRERGAFSLATREAFDRVVSVCERFQVNGDGGDLWEKFETDGTLPNALHTRPSRLNERIGAGICVTLDLMPGQSRTIPFALSWDFPITRFGSTEASLAWYKRYTKFFGRASSTGAMQMCVETLLHYREWEAAIDAWQKPILEDTRTPLWYKTALFNELYTLVDNGTIWEDGRVEAAEQEESPEPEAAAPAPLFTKPPPSSLLSFTKKQPELPPPPLLSDSEPKLETSGRFGLLESRDRPFYNTLDAAFYGSFGLLQLWPALEKQVIRQFSAAIEQASSTSLRPQQDSSTSLRTSGAQLPRTRAGIAPHDLGSPAEGPWLSPNSYRASDTGQWKDLNSKFVLLAYRDFLATRDHALLEACWPACRLALAGMERFDRNGDGLPDHASFPDQSYRNWTLRGASAYCSSLWLAALQAGKAIAMLLGDTGSAQRYGELFLRGQRTFETTLWNGQYYNLDSGSPRRNRTTSMADQLCGQWYADVCHLPSVVSSERIQSALLYLYHNNLKKFGRGRMGFVNGMRTNGEADHSSHDAAEVSTGPSYGLAAFLLSRGLEAYAWEAALGIYLVTYEARGYWFRTPGQWDEQGNYRLPMDLRSQAIWAIHYALEQQAKGK